MCSTTSSSRTSGSAITCSAKKRFRVASPGLKSPMIHSVRPVPITGIAPNSEMITLAPQYDIWPHGNT